jgi:NADH-quinone oxidoreductase subunit L
MNLSLMHLILFLPLFSAIFSGFYSFSKPCKIPQIVSTLSVITAAFSSICLLWQVFFLKYEETITFFNIIDVYGFVSNLSFRLDKLSSMMLCLVTFVSSCVHVYSMSYMSDDPNINRFFSYLSLFTFCMIALVTGDDFIQVFFGWEGVGVSSYLLISFWFKKNSASSAATKAFIANRVGDLCLIIAISLCYYLFRSVNFTEITKIFSQYSDNVFNFFGYEVNIITLICIFMFIGCMGKSAQFGLHVWLPDAMEGPTPVSALIHAATMVTAGIFLVARCYYFFDVSIDAQSIILLISSVTAIFAAIVAIFQTDIKKIIAYSTCSQLAYMFLGCAVGHYNFGMFHLLTHGFFKALLFLSAGIIIHATHKQEINELPGNLYKKMPYTFILMLIGTLAITGVPPFAGYYSKDAIIEALMSDSNHGMYGSFAYFISVVTVFLSGIYSWKLIFKIFFNKNQEDDNAHESGFLILLPMFLLSLLSISSGFILMTYFDLGDLNVFASGIDVKAIKHHASHGFIEHLPLVLSCSSFIFAYYLYIRRQPQKSIIDQFSPVVYQFLSNKFYIDELYDYIFVRPILRIACWASFFDKEVLDKYGPDVTRPAVYSLSNNLKIQHSGLIHKYAFWQFLILTIFTVYFVLLAYNLV